MNKKTFFIVIGLFMVMFALIGGQPNVEAESVDMVGGPVDTSIETIAGFGEVERTVKQERLTHRRDNAPYISSLKMLSIDRLRKRSFSSTITIEEQLGDDAGSSEYSQYFGAPYYNTYMASYKSDRLRVYTRVDIPPTEMPEDGYPVIIFAHGWTGDKPGYTFNYSAGSYYGDMLDAYVKAGYIVLMPGFRGHGTVNGVPAEGLEYVEAYDNGSYLSPIFYAIDILNLLGGVDSLDDVDWEDWGLDEIEVDTSRIFLTAHSQGGDAATTAMAVSSSPKMENSFAAGSIWAGSIQGPVEQGAFFGPQERSADAWDDPAYFPFMPSWWSPDWSPYTIEEGIAYRKAQMYDTVREYVADQKHADPETNSLMPIMAKLNAHNYPQYFTAPFDLHYSNMDHYSIPEWNETLVRKIRMAGTASNAYMYEGNSHEFGTVDGWSPAGSVPGRATAIARTIALFDSTP